MSFMPGSLLDAVQFARFHDRDCSTERGSGVLAYHMPYVVWLSRIGGAREVASASSVHAQPKAVFSPTSTAVIDERLAARVGWRRQNRPRKSPRRGKSCMRVT